MAELGTALGHSKTSELVLSPSAWRHVSHVFQGEELEDANVRVMMEGCPVLANLGAEPKANDSSFQKSVSNSRFGHQLLPSGLKRFEANILNRSNGTLADMAEKVVRKAANQMLLAQPAPHVSRESSYVSARTEASQAESDSAYSVMAQMMDPLLYYMPSFVRDRCVSGEHLDMLAEHRHVSVLFLIGKPKNEWLVQSMRYGATIFLQLY
eukprot:scaffold169778_cov28-Prasinocladus_malaysianus.AAC.1